MKKSRAQLRGERRRFRQMADRALAADIAADKARKRCLARVNLRIPPPSKAAWLRAALAQGLPLSTLIRAAVDEYVSKEGGRERSSKGRRVAKRKA